MNSRQGYSLIEVLVAFTVMALVLATLIPAQAQFLRRATDNTDQLLAMDLALSKLSYLNVVEPISIGSTTTEQDGWVVNIEIMQADDLNTGLNLLRATAIVRDSSGKQLAEVSQLFPAHE